MKNWVTTDVDRTVFHLPFMSTDLRSGPELRTGL